MPTALAAVRSVAERNALVEENLGLAWHVANRARRWPSVRRLGDEAESIACLALLRAAELWRPDLGPSAPYAARCIKGQLALAAARAARAG